MRSYLFKDKPERLSQYLAKVFPELRFSYFKILLKQRNISVSGKRVSQDVFLRKGDCIEIYCNESKLLKFNYETIYRDDNVLIAVKPRGVQSEEFASRVSSTENIRCALAHRLDTNTRGLIVMTLNDVSAKEFFTAFKKGWVIKKYVALVVGNLTEKLDLHAFLVKNADEGTVKIYGEKVSGGVPIHTEVEPIDSREDTTLVEVTLHTGKTHQIRAHLAYAGYPIVGDTKYGNFDKNRELKAKRQYLTAYKLAFRMPSGSPLKYLNELELGIPSDF